MRNGARLGPDYPAPHGAILDERAGEQVRWFDLKRTNQLADRVKANNPEAGASIRPYHTLWPIPQRQLDAILNGNAFTQNQGYR